MDSVVPQYFPSPGMFCTGGNISQCQWLILEFINCLRKWTRITQMTNPDKWQKLLRSVHLCSKWLQNYRFEVGTGCQSSTGCVNAHHTQPEYPFLPFITVQNKKEKIPECQQYHKRHYTPRLCLSVCHTNYLYSKNHKFLTITFIFTIQMCLWYLPILEVRNLKFKEWSNFLENRAGTFQQSTETNFSWPPLSEEEEMHKSTPFGPSCEILFVFRVFFSCCFLFSLSSQSAKLHHFWCRILEFAAGNGKATRFWNVWL